MAELWLNFRDEQGFDQRAAVGGDRFVIGRTPGGDLVVPHQKLSRRHAKIERFGEVFVVSDLGSSNGTSLNGAPLREPVALKDGDVLDLGGGVEMRVELVAAPVRARRENAASAAGSVEAAGGSSIPTAVFFVAPALALALLVCGGGLLYFLRDGAGPQVVDTRRNERFETPDETPDETPEPTKTPTPGPSDRNSNAVEPATPTPVDANDPPPEISSEAKRVAQHSSAFLRRIAPKDDNPFLTAAQLGLLGPKINAFKGSSALAENFRAAKASSAQIASLAESKGLTAQFLATAALAQLGNARGNPAAVAQEMLPVFAQLRTSLDNSLADDCLLMVAAYNQGKANEFRKLRNIMEALALKNPGASPREIRSVWFLKKQDKLSDAEFDFALRFLAIGTIAQNPADFAVNAEAVIFN